MYYFFQSRKKINQKTNVQFPIKKFLLCFYGIFIILLISKIQKNPNNHRTQLEHSE